MGECSSGPVERQTSELTHKKCYRKEYRCLAKIVTEDRLLLAPDSFLDIWYFF